MNLQTVSSIRQAEANDASDLAKLIDIAGEGIPAWLWAQKCQPGQSPLDVGVDRARREDGGFSYKNAIVAERNGAVMGMVLSYPITEAPAGDPSELPAPIIPFVELEAHSVGTWYINALAIFAGHREAGIGTKLLNAAETQAAAAGYPVMSIQVYAQNTAAFRLYERLGYTIAARAKVHLHPCQPYYTGDVLLLLKRLVD
ncbi:MAG: GNAT family N-acetyltransferase [Pseudomonadota bacterium]